jgi:hypothetical protein
MTHEAFFDVLRSERDALNAAFAAARRQFPALAEDAFKSFLIERVAPLAGFAERHARERVAPVVLAAYEVGLELVGQNLAGPGARHPAVDHLFQLVLPACMGLVSRHPLAIMAALSNAAHHLASTSGARAGFWIDELARTGPRAAEIDELLALGQVLAWRAGLAHFRSGALAACSRLPEPLARAALGLDAAQDLASVRARLEHDPWFDPAHPNKNPAARWVGAFRGFGGLFEEPPRVSTSAGQILVESGPLAWLLTADAFGATFHRATEAEVATRLRPALPAAIGFDDGTVRYYGHALPLIARGAPTTAAALPHTLAITFATTHELALCALQGAP